MMLSFILLLIGITFINKYYKFTSKNTPAEPNDFTIMSYNVRLFNVFNWLPNPNVGQEIKKFIDEKNPDILCIQEYSERANICLLYTSRCV